MPQTILITGGAGFIGSHLCEILLALGHQVIAIDDLSTGRISNIQHLIGQQGFEFIQDTILNANILERTCAQSSLVIHLAAAVGVKLIVENPVHTIQTNVSGSEMVLRTAHRFGCKVMLASSSEVYGKGVGVPFHEEDDCLIGPTSHSRWAYAASKALDEFLGLAYNHQYGLPVVIMRFFNTIGPRQTGRYGMVVPRFVRQALSNEALQVYGDGQQTRCFADVADVVRAIQLLMENEQAVGQVFNIGSTHEITIRQLAERIIQLTKSRSEIISIPYDQAYAPGFEDLRRRVPSIERIATLTGFQPQFSLDETLQRVITSADSPT
jgi:UDP-glucose 4-epimerase